MAATLSGAHCAGLGHKTGSLTPGKQADIVLICANDLNLFPSNNAAGTVVHAADRSNLDTVIIGGKVRKRRGLLLDTDLAKLRELVEVSRSHLFKAVGYAPNTVADEFPGYASP